MCYASRLESSDLSRLLLTPTGNLVLTPIDALNNQSASSYVPRQGQRVVSCGWYLLISEVRSEFPRSPGTRQTVPWTPRSA